MQFFCFGVSQKQERGRENASFPVVEILKPMGFKERSDVLGQLPRIVTQNPKRGSGNDSPLCGKKLGINGS